MSRTADDSRPDRAGFPEDGHTLPCEGVRGETFPPAGPGAAPRSAAFLETAAVAFAVPPDDPARFLPFFLTGVAVAVPRPMSVDALFRDIWKLPAGRIADELKTVFVNNAPLDDFTRATLAPGDALSLSGPMPGLAGATMRAGGVLAGFRRGLGRSAAAGGAVPAGDSPFFIEVRLFNILTETLAGPLLAAGFHAPLGRLLDFLARQPRPWQAGVLVRHGDRRDALDDCQSDLLDADPESPALVMARPGE